MLKGYLEISTRYMKYKKKRTFITVLGVSISIALITIMVIVNLSIRQNKIRQTSNLYGNFHAEIKDINKEQVAILKKHLMIDKVGVKRKLTTCTLVDKMIYIDVGNYDKSARNFNNIELLRGRFPVSDYEIILEEWIVKELGLMLGVNENVSLEFISNNEKEYKVYSKIPEYFKLVGVLKNRYQPETKKTVGHTSFRTIDRIYGEDIKYDVYIEINNQLDINESMESIKKTMGFSDDKFLINYNFINSLGKGEEKNHFIQNFLIFIAIIVCIATTYNLLNVSIFDRIREFGSLRAIGCTSKQIRILIFREAVFLSMISIPIGILLGLISIEFCFIYLEFFREILNVVVITRSTLLFIISTSFIAIILAAIAPAIFAGRVPILDAIKINSKILYKNDLDKKNHSSIFTKLFGISGKIAYQNIWRNRKRAHITIFSMSIGVMLCILLGSFIYSFNPNEVIIKNNDSSLKKLLNDNEENHGYISLVRAENNYPTMFFIKLESSRNKNKIEKKTSYYSDDFNNNHSINKTDGYISANVYRVDDNKLKVLSESLKYGHIDKEKMSLEETVIITEDFEYFNPEVKVGDIISIRIIQIKDYKIKDKELQCKIGGIISKNDYIEDLNDDGPTIIIHDNILNQHMKLNEDSEFNIAVKWKSILTDGQNNLSKKNHNDANESLAILSYDGNKYKNYTKQISIITVCLIIIVIIIGIFNIMNTISINLAMRIREFSIFRALGMTRFQLRKSIILEGVFYGVISSIIGSIIGIFGTYVSFEVLAAIFPEIPWQMSFEIIVISILGCIFISILSVMIPLKSFSKINIVDYLRSLE